MRRRQCPFRFPFRRSIRPRPAPRRPAFEVMEGRRLLATTITVTSDADAGTGTLRAAITQADATPGPVVIDFAIPGTGVQTIAVATDLPQITNALTIDGTSQGGPGYQGTPLIALVAATDSQSDPAMIGLDFAAGGDSGVVRGLAIEGFLTAGIFIAADGVTVAGNAIGTDPAGDVSSGNGDGVDITGADNVIGGTAAADRNLISGNTNDGLQISGAAASGNLVENNLIGTNPAGDALSNLSVGVVVADAPGNTVFGNVIADNGTPEGQGAGLLVNGAGATGNAIRGNSIVDNLGFGVALVGAPGNTLGGTAPSDRNLVSGNTFSGVFLSGAGATGDVVEGNFIGLEADGVTPQGNGQDGVLIDAGAVGNTIGGAAVGAGNVISGNAADGIHVQNGSPSNAILGNAIGTVAGLGAPLPNAANGITIDGSAGNTVGGDTAASANTVAGNIGSGVVVTGTAATGNLIRGNFIGTDAALAAGLGNGQDGVLLTAGASNNTTGGTAAGDGNTIDDNGQTGVQVESGTGDGILGNSIYQNAHLGIVLGTGGVVPDDSQGHSGPNDFQDFPVLTAVDSAGASTVIRGTLQGTPDTSIRVEFFSNDVPDPSGFGQGQTFLGPATITVTTDATGNASFTATLSSPLAAGQFVTATATDPGNNTSEFSAVAPVTVLALAIGDATGSEGTSGTSDLDFSVTLSAPSPLTTTVAYTTIDGTAVAGRDYVATSGTLTFAPGVTTQTIAVPIIGSPAFKPTETFTVALSDPQNASIVRAQGTGTILNDHSAGQLQFAASSFVASEDDGVATITVTRTGGDSVADVDVPYATGGGTAVPGVDYTPVSGTLVFAPGQVSQTFTVPVIANMLLGPSTTVGLSLGAPTGGGTLGPQSTAVLTIVNPNSLVVTNTDDDGPGSLRRTIEVADANPGPNTITFAIPGNAPFVIRPLTPLPAVTDPVTIDATTQPGYAGTPIVDVDGILAGGSADGLALDAGPSTVRGLAIDRFAGAGISIQGAGGDTISDDILGTDAAGDAGLGNGTDGVTIVQSSGNTIGPGDVFAGNALVGVRIEGGSSSGNIIAGNLIGTDPTGMHALGNGSDGIFLDGAPNNTIGGTTPAARNVVSGNASVGIQLLGPGASENLVEGNFLGTDASGTARVANGLDGVFVNGAPDNIIGGTDASARNLISGNLAVGVRLSGAGATGNLVEGNLIGTDLSGTAALANADDGVFAIDAPGNTIGGTSAGAGNILSGNGEVGVQLFGAGATGNLVQGNRIGTDVTGTAPLGNGLDGVFVNAAPGNTIGGTIAAASNLISANGSSGVQLFEPQATGNVVQGNLIGTDASGAPRLGNAYGIFINGAPGNTIGGAGTSANVVAGNTRSDVFQTPGDGVEGPLVTGVSEAAPGGTVTSIVVGFSSSLDPSRAQDPNNYRLRQLGRAARSTSTIPLTSAVYDPAGRTVTLTLAHPVPSSTRLQLTVSASRGTGVSGPTGLLLDGDSNGRPGGNFTTLLGSTPTPSPSPLHRLATPRPTHRGASIAQRSIPPVHLSTPKTASSRPKTR